MKKNDGHVRHIFRHIVMKGSAKLILDKRRKLKDDSYPIAIRINHKRQPIYSNMDYAVLPGQWNEDGTKLSLVVRNTVI